MAGGGCASPGKRPSFLPEMIHIPGGSFVMGTGDAQVNWLVGQFDEASKWRDRGYFRREQPQHTVSLPAYCISRYPLTVGEYRPFLNAGGYHSREYWTDAGWAWRVAHGRRMPDLWDNKQWAGDDRLPVVGVSWYEAHAFCQWLRAVTGREYRLPTEAEWEKAARGTDGRLYPWGNTFDERRCNIRSAGPGRTTLVGQYSPQGDSPYGCIDMIGNVSEWTRSAFRSFPYAADDGRDNPEGDAERVIRGASWHSPTLRARVVARGMNDPWFADSDVGFRCVCYGALVSVVPETRQGDARSLVAWGGRRNLV
jgi:formylglycine-generating enzyme required for sulfatase activity